MNITFEGKRALVTGASKGIGRDIALQLAKCGAKVVAISRDKNLLDTLKTEQPSIETVVVDLSNWDETEKILANVGPIDLLVNNAGFASLEPIGQITEANVDRIFNVNVKAVMNVTQIISNSMKARKAPGAIVNISSQASAKGLLDHAAYCASKGAVDAFTRVAALELGPHNIRVNTVNPTVILTDMGKLGWADPKKANPMLNRIPLRRFGEVHEVVDTVLYLLSDKASLINGHSLFVDGGFVAC